MPADGSSEFGWSAIRARRIHCCRLIHNVLSMKKSDAYQVLAAELESWRRLGYSALTEQVGQPAVTKSVPLGQEEISVQVRIRWADAERRSIRIEATADGPSCWRLERLEESVTVSPSHATRN